LNNKLLAVIVVVILAVAGVSAYVLLSDNSNKDVRVNLLAGVNNEGSGIYIRNSLNADDLLTIDGEGNVEYHPEGWKGLVFGVPGVATIQYVQLMEIVTEELNFKFENFGSNVTGDVVYYYSNVTTADVANQKVDENAIDGGIIWEPQYQMAIAGAKFKELATTDVLFPDHICCVVAGNMSYVEANENAMVDFLSALIKADKWLNETLAAGSGEDYDEMMRIAKNNFKNMSDAVIIASLRSVVYTYGTDTVKPLSNWNSQIASLVDSLENLGQLTRSVKDLGFDDGAAFADAFVNDKYLVQALADDGRKSDSVTKVRVALISGDIHQFAVQLARDLGYFEEYGLEVEVVGATAGPIVISKIRTHEADIGLLGAPPLTTNTINGKLI